MSMQALSWHLIVNTTKTKIVVFNRCFTGYANKNIAKQEREQFKKHLTFLYNGINIEIVSQFKYLGSMFYEDVMYTANKMYGNAMQNL